MKKKGIIILIPHMIFLKMMVIPRLSLNIPKHARAMITILNRPHEFNKDVVIWKEYLIKNQNHQGNDEKFIPILVEF